MDALFWLVVTIAVLALLAAWFGWGTASSLRLDLEVAEDEIRDAHAANDRLRAQARHHIVRGERG